MKRFLAILAAYTLATYVEALSWRIYLLHEGAGIDVILEPKAVLSLMLSPILFPIKYAAFLRVRSTTESTSVPSLDSAPLVTFIAAFIGAYIIIRRPACPPGEPKVGIFPGRYFHKFLLVAVSGNGHNCSPVQEVL